MAPVGTGPGTASCTGAGTPLGREQPGPGELVCGKPLPRICWKAEMYYLIMISDSRLLTFISIGIQN